MPENSMRVGLVGAGGVAFGTAAFCVCRGHSATIWSPSGGRTGILAEGAPLKCSGAMEGSFDVGVAKTLSELVETTDIVMFALPAYAHKPIIEELATLVGVRHTVIFGAHASLEALFFQKCLLPRKIDIPVAAWGSTIGTCRQLDLASVEVGTLRDTIDACGLPASLSPQAMTTCKDLFGDRFVDRGDLLSVTLSNFNPQHHLGIGLGNMTRMEKGEHWIQPEFVTPNVGRLLEALDRERLALGAAAGCDLRDIYEFFEQSYQVPHASVSDMNATLLAKGMGGPGPKTADNRYVNEDVPYGLAVTVALAQMADVPTPLHSAGIDLFSAMYDRDLASENKILSQIITPGMTLMELKSLCSQGYTG